MNLRSHIAAATLLFTLTGCIFGGGTKKEDVSIRPVGKDSSAMVGVDGSGEFDKAKDPKINADTLYAAGQLHESRNNVKAAIDQYKAAVKLNEEHHGSLYRLGVLYATTKQYPEAIAAWKKYIDSTHHSAVGYSNLGFTYELSGDPAEAERAYLTGIERDSDSAPCRVNYGLMLARHGRIDDGIAQMKPVLSEAEVHFNVGSVHEGQGRNELARAEYQKALQLDPKLRDARVRLQKLDSITAINPAE